jgi:hypothetical protein
MMDLSNVVLHIQQGIRTDPSICILGLIIHNPDYIFVYMRSEATGWIELGATSKAKCVMLVACSPARTRALTLTAGSTAKVCESLKRG